MFLNEMYNYEFVDNTEFDIHYLVAKKEGVVDKYIWVFYEEDGVVKNKKVNNTYDSKEENLLVKYYVEEANIGSDFELSHSIYYSILGIGIIHEYDLLDEDEEAIKDETKAVEKAIKEYNGNWKDMEIEEEKFFID